MRKLLKKYASAPERLVTDDLRSYAPAARLFFHRPRSYRCSMPRSRTLAEANPHFLRLYPKINLDISVDSVLGPDLVAGGFDAGIHAAEFLARNVIAVRVSGEIPIVVAAAPAYLAQALRTEDATRARSARLHPHSIVGRRLLSVALPHQAPDLGGSVADE
jgi:DNA-binding transcriptional LysR family regulator